MALPTYRQIEAFKAVMDTGRVTDAATRLHLSQPAVSKLLSNFESALGMRLFVRAKKRLTPTVEAEAIVREINKIFVGVQEISRFATQLRSMRTGELTIVSIATFGQRLLPKVLASFLRYHPAVNVGLHLRSSAEVAEWTASQRADVGISMMPVDHPAVRDEMLCEVDAVCVIPNGHRLRDVPVIEPHHLAGENFVSFMRDGRLRHVIDSVFENARVQRELRIDTFLSDSACALVAAEVGVSIVEPFTAFEYARAGRLMAKPFVPGVRYEFRLLFPRFREPSLVAQAFVKELRGSIDEFLAPVVAADSHVLASTSAVIALSPPRRKAPTRRNARAQE